MQKIIFCTILGLFFLACSNPKYDLLLKNSLVVDGSGEDPYRADIAIIAENIEAIGQNLGTQAEQIIDASGQVVAPGFIDMLSWACGPVLYDGKVPSVVRQGITTVVFGEGWSMGPLNEPVIKELKSFWPEYKIGYNWKTLADYLRYVETKGTSVNIASYIGATTVRLYVLGSQDRAPTRSELEEMKDLVAKEMQAGAFGVASSLVYAPAFYATTDELTELCKVAAAYGGIYASHVRGEGADLLSSLQELIEISRNANIPAEIYHLKSAGRENWSSLDAAIQLIETARGNGLDITADIYPYTAGATGLDAMIPPWFKEGGDEKMVQRLKDSSLRKQIKQDIETRLTGWDNFYYMSGGGKNIIVSYTTDKNLQGKSIADIAKKRGLSEIETVFDLLIEEKGGGGGIYFFMSEENIRKKMRLPWVSFCTDEDAYQPEGLMGQRNPHPRAYGTFPRILGRYVREEKILTLQEAIRKMTSLPAQRLGLRDRGLIKEGMKADLVIFDPEKVIDNSTYTQPHQFPVGIHHVIINGTLVVQNGKHSGAKPGRAIFKSL